MMMMIKIIGHECIWGTVWDGRQKKGREKEKDTEG
jgi:hypothetical protein